MENVFMLEDCPFSNILCDVCGKDVEILNNDLSFSIELHNQSHKKLSDVNCLIPGCREKTEKNLDTVQNHSQNYHCATCNKYFEIFNNDFELSLQLHTQNHELNNKIQTKETLASNDLSSLDKTFNTFSPGLKCHRYFVYELDDNNAFCKVCNLEVGNFLSISNHLKTKLHEDNTILLLKQKLPSSLHYEMEFVSFFGSHLYCNLCNSIIILCSNNIHETVLNIISHNSCETHLKYNTDNDSQEEYNEASSVLKDLAKYENSKNKNKSYIDFKIVPQFRCNLCNTNIAYNENKTRMLNNLTNHLQNSTHKKLHNALVVEELESDYISSAVKHKFIPKDDGILCLACNSLVKENIGDLISHIKKNNCCKKLKHEPNLNDNQLPVGSNTSIKPLDLFSNNDEDENDSNMYGVREKLEIILNTLPKKLDISWIKTDELEQVVCIACTCILTISTTSIKQHLSGTRHKNNTEKKVINSLFENIPGNLQGNKSFIKVPEGEKTRVFCSKCNVKISAHYKCLLEHLQGAYHTRSFTKPIEGQSKKDYKPEIAKLLELQQTKTCEQVISKNDLVEQFSLLSLKMSSETSELKCILDELSEQYETSCITLNEKGEVICVICNCRVSLCKNVIKQHLAGMNHTKNEKFSLLSLKMSSGPSELKCILNDLPEQFKTSCLKMNKKGRVICKICHCPVFLSKKVIKEHLGGIKHLANENKKLVNKLFQNIPGNLQSNKSFIKFIATDKSHVLCNKCNVKIRAHHTNLLQHLQDSYHTRAFTEPVEV